MMQRALSLLLVAALACLPGGAVTQPAPTPISPLTGNEQFVLQSNGTQPCTVPCFTTANAIKTFAGGGASGGIVQIGKLSAVDLTATGDHVITLPAGTWFITDFIMGNPSVQIPGGGSASFYSQASAGGVRLVNGNIYGIFAGSLPQSQYADAAGAGDMGPFAALVSGHVYFNVATPVEAPCTVDIYVLGIQLQ
jgi:hypothetical protein